jgi:hypothetical protein
MRKNPERVAWTVLWASFVIFACLAVGGPLSLRWYLIHSKRPQTNRLEVISGPVLVQRQEGQAPFGVTQAMEVEQGHTILTDADSWALLELFDRSTVVVYGDTRLRLVETAAPRFQLSKESGQVELELTGGSIRVGVALPSGRDVDFRVTTPHTQARLQEDGSYRVEVTNELSRVTVLYGQATVGQPAGTRVLLDQGRRTEVRLEGEPLPPLPAARNLVQDGSFHEPLGSVWLTDTVVLSSTVQPPRAQVVGDGGRPVVQFARRGSDEGHHSEASITQRIDQDVRDFDYMSVALNVRLLYQSLSGGGQLNSEFPIIVRVDYKDLWGNEKFWTQGFYYQNDAGFVIPQPDEPIAYGSPGLRVLQAQWWPYESGNLIDLLGSNRPVFITSITIYASGWNYESEVTDVQVIIE